MPSLPSVMASMAVEIYAAAASAATASSTVTSSSSSNNNNSNNCIPLKQEEQEEQAREQLKQLVADLNENRFLLSSVAATPSQSAASRKRKKSSISSVTSPQQSNAATTSARALPTSMTAAPPDVHRIRKLKLYTIEEKIDIIDYAKIIGNRAAGREFNVAESSIREWRKNEDKLRYYFCFTFSKQSKNILFRRQIETSTSGTQHFEQSNPLIIAEIDKDLVSWFISDKDFI